MLITTPPEILGHILAYVDNDALVSLSSTSRNLNACVVPHIYRHTDLDIWLTDEITERYDAPLTALRGLAANFQGQCQHIKS
ncbi:hypothetical protein BJX63DRAFT_433901 [Aspergillus granulosus]|uniref:F-box domain-containing protein n=1 Tax=Aspergillus granulosus TaxID=176169 RepID=A0ABR4H5W3_9EURO